MTMSASVRSWKTAFAIVIAAWLALTSAVSAFEISAVEHHGQSSVAGDTVDCPHHPDVDYDAMPGDQDTDCQCLHGCQGSAMVVIAHIATGFHPGSPNTERHNSLLLPGQPASPFRPPTV